MDFNFAGTYLFICLFSPELSLATPVWPQVTLFEGFMHSMEDLSHLKSAENTGSNWLMEAWKLNLMSYKYVISVNHS